MFKGTTKRTARPLGPTAGTVMTAPARQGSPHIHYSHKRKRIRVGNRRSGEDGKLRLRPLTGADGVADESAGDLDSHLSGGVQIDFGAADAQTLKTTPSHVKRCDPGVPNRRFRRSSWPTKRCIRYFGERELDAPIHLNIQRSCRGWRIRTARLITTC